MTTVRKTITLTSKLDEWIKSQTNGGEFTNDSEYIRDLIRRDRDQKSKLLALRAAIQEGLDSGVSDRTVGDIWAEAEARHRSKHG
jgi:antitoxin ParD1/3/4